jgi:hypothetical protein
MSEYYIDDAELSSSPEDSWIYFEPIMDYAYEIHTFDDGNEKNRHHENRWHIFGEWRGKNALVNAANPLIKIHSISNWKLVKIIV